MSTDDGYYCEMPLGGTMEDACSSHHTTPSSHPEERIIP